MFPNLLNLICVDLWEFWDKKVSFVAERPLEAEKRGNLSGKLFQNDDMSPAVDRRENVTKPLPLPSGTLHRYDNVTYSRHISFKN